MHSDGTTVDAQLVVHRTRRNRSKSEEALSRKSRVTSAQSGPRRPSYGASEVHGDEDSLPEADRDEGEGGGTRTVADAAHTPGGVCLLLLVDHRSSQEVAARSS